MGSYYIALPSALTALNKSHRVRTSGKEEAVNGKVVTLRFAAPGGPMSEYHLGETAPKVGEVLTRGKGNTWKVVAVEDAKDGTSVVTLKPA